MEVLFRNCPDQIGMQCVGCGMIYLSLIACRAHQNSCPKIKEHQLATSNRIHATTSTSAYESLETEHNSGAGEA